MRHVEVSMEIFLIVQIEVGERLLFYPGWNSQNNRVRKKQSLSLNTQISFLCIDMYTGAQCWRKSTSKRRLDVLPSRNSILFLLVLVLIELLGRFFIHFIPKVQQTILIIGTKRTEIGQHDVLILFLAGLRTSPFLSQTEIPTPIEAIVEWRTLTISRASRRHTHRSRIAMRIVDIGDNIDQHAATDVNVVDVLIFVAHTRVEDETVAESKQIGEEEGGDRQNEKSLRTVWRSALGRCSFAAFDPFPAS